MYKHIYIPDNWPFFWLPSSITNQGLRRWLSCLFSANCQMFTPSRIRCLSWNLELSFRPATSAAANKIFSKLECLHDASGGKDLLVVLHYRRKLHESRVRQSLMCNANATKRPNWSEIGHKLNSNFVVIQTEEDGSMTGCQRRGVQVNQCENCKLLYRKPNIFRSLLTECGVYCSEIPWSYNKY